MSKQEEGGEQVITRRGFLGALLGVVAGFAGRRAQSAQAATAEPPVGSYVGVDGLVLKSSVQANMLVPPIESGWAVTEPEYGYVITQQFAGNRYIATLPLENGTVDTLGTVEKDFLFLKLFENGAIDLDTCGLLIHGSRSRWKQIRPEVIAERKKAGLE